MPSTEQAATSTLAIAAIAVGLGSAAGLATYLASDATTAVLIAVTFAFCAAAGLALGNKIDEQYGDWLRGERPRER
jgi:uncharacterized membrane protein YadS